MQLAAIFRGQITATITSKNPHLDGCHNSLVPTINAHRTIEATALSEK